MLISTEDAPPEINGNFPNVDLKKTIAIPKIVATVKKSISFCKPEKSNINNQINTAYDNQEKTGISGELGSKKITTILCSLSVEIGRLVKDGIPIRANRRNRIHQGFIFCICIDLFSI